MDNYDSPLISIQGQIDGIRSDIFGLNAGLTNISGLLQNDRISERLRLREEEQQERELIQKQIRVGQETEIEKKVTNAIASPIKKVEDKVSNTFNGISSSLSSLFGSISLLGIKSLGFAASTLGKTINGTKSLIANSLRLITGSISSLGSGFGLVYRSVLGVTKNVSNITSKLALSPFKAVSNAFRSIFKVGGAGAGAAAAVGGAEFSTFSKLLTGVAAPALAVGFDMLGGEKPERALAGGVTGYGGAVLTGAAAGSLFGPVGSLIGGGLGYLGASSLGKSIYDKVQGGKNIFSASNQTFEELRKNSQDFISNTGNILTGTSESKPAEAPVSPMNVENQQSNPIPLAVEPYKPPLSTKDLTLPESKPDIIYTSTLSGQQDQQAPTMTTPEDIPAISSANPDNFYVLYSQLNYNVVM